MSSPEIIQKPKVSIDPDILAKIEAMPAVESQVVVHCVVSAPILGDLGIRIWPSTYLYCVSGAHKSDLVHHENISAYPDWQYIKAGRSGFFTLFFSGLPKSVTTFDLVEEIPESHGFEVRGIDRNQTDVYYVRF